MAVWTANKETTIDDYSTANRMEDHSISLNSRAHLAGCAEDRGNFFLNWHETVIDQSI